MRILALHRQQSAVGYYRTWLPARALAAAGHDVTWWEDAPYNTVMHKYALQHKARFEEAGIDFKTFKRTPELWFQDRLTAVMRGEEEPYDIILTEKPIKFDDSATLAGFKHYMPNCRMICDFDDDFLDVPHWNLAAPKWHPGQEFREAGLRHMRFSELTTVSTETLAEKFSPHAHKIRAIPNLIDPLEWSNRPVNPERSLDSSVRIFYGGASGHYGDMDAARPGLEAFLRNPPCPIHFVIVGASPAWLHELREEFPDRIWNIDYQSIHDYPDVVAWGGFDIAIAPLAQHPFNEAKSDIKWLEASLQGMAFFCSNVGPYREIPAGLAIRVDNDEELWQEGLIALCENSRHRKEMAAEAKEYVLRERTLDAKGHLWHNTVEEAATLPRIERLEDTRLPSDEQRLA